MLSLFEKLTLIFCAPETTWRFVMMWPALSITNPEPSPRSASCVGKKPNGSDDCRMVVVETRTTPGRARA
jgi:hypothetical protein